MTAEERILEPCPFCGSNDLSFNGDTPDMLWVRCSGCGGSGPTVDYPPACGSLPEKQLDFITHVVESMVIDIWNKRAHDKCSIVIGCDVETKPPKGSIRIPEGFGYDE